MKSIGLTHQKKQNLLILLCFLAYTLAYVGRYSYNANITLMIEHYGVTKADTGMVSTFFFFAYGAAQLLNAIFCKFYPKRYVVAGSLLVSAGINLVLFFLPPFPIIKYLWLINGICQSVLWPSLMLTIGETLDQSLMKRAVLAMSLSVAAGTLIAYGGSALFNTSLFSMPDSFRLSFILGTVMTAAIGVIWFLSYNTLTSEGYAQTAKKEEAANKAEKTRRGVQTALVGLLTVCAIFAIVDNFVKDGLNTWSPDILKTMFGFDDSISIIMTLVLPLFGVFGSVLALQTNRFLKDFRALVGFFYLILSACLVGLVFILSGCEETLALGESVSGFAVVFVLILFGLVSCLTHGINSVLTSIMPLAMRDRINSGFLAGLMNATCYVGSTASAYGLGKIADGKGWLFAIRILLIASAAAMLLAGVVMLLKMLQRKPITEEKE